MPALLRCLFPRNMGSGSHWLGWRCDEGGQMDLYGFVMRAVAHFIILLGIVG